MLSKRRFLESLALGAAACYTPSVLAQMLARTQTTGDGPFYPAFGRQARR